MNGVENKARRWEIPQNKKGEKPQIGKKVGSRNSIENRNGLGCPRSLTKSDYGWLVIDDVDRRRWRFNGDRNNVENIKATQGIKEP